ncbi:MAG: NAD(+)/NADH kinase [Candidatus Bipolaricaulia bacterium]
MEIRLERLLLLVNFAKPGAAQLVERIFSWGRERGIEVAVHGSLEEVGLEEEGSGTVVVTLGGDGTFLRGAHRFAAQGAPLLGINLGSLGFLTQVGAEEALQALERLRRGEFRLEERMMLEGRLREEEFLALNELFLAPKAVGGFTELELFANGERVGLYPGDGLILATPTGSTAYSLAAGGPIVDPRLEIIIVTPVAPHRLGLRTAIFPPETELKVLTRQPATLLVDGDLARELPPGEELLVRRSACRVKLVMPDSPGFFALLERKLNWSGFRTPP